MRGHSLICFFRGADARSERRRARRSDCSPLACVGRWGGRVAGPTARITVRGAFGSLRSQVGSRWLTGDRRAGYCGNVCWLRAFSRSFPLSRPVRTCPEDRYEPVMSCGRWLRMREEGADMVGRHALRLRTGGGYVGDRNAGMVRIACGESLVRPERLAIRRARRSSPAAAAMYRRLHGRTFRRRPPV